MVNFLNYLLSQKDVWEYFRYNSFESIYVVWSLVTIAILLIIGIIINYKKPELLSKFGIFVSGFAVATTVFLLVKIRADLIGATFKHEGDYKTPFLIILFTAIIVLSIFVAFIKFGNKERLQHKSIKYLVLLIGVLLIIATIVLFSIVWSKNPKPVDGYYLSLKGNLGIMLGLSMAMLVFGVIFISTVTMKGASDTKFIAQSSVALALSFALSYIKIFRMPQGGSITLASLLPIAIIAYIYGFRKGLLIGFIFGLLQSITDAYIVHPIQFLLDYSVAYAFIGIIGLFSHIKKFDLRINMSLGILVFSIFRYFSHIISGVVFFAAYANGQNPFVYSAGYNSFVFADSAILLVIAIIFLSSGKVKKIIKENKERLAEKQNI